MVSKSKPSAGASIQAPVDARNTAAADSLARKSTKRHKRGREEAASVQADKMERCFATLCTED